MTGSSRKCPGRRKRHVHALGRGAVPGLPVNIAAKLEVDLVHAVFQRKFDPALFRVDGLDLQRTVVLGLDLDAETG
jgi:hypothetical protein